MVCALPDWNKATLLTDTHCHLNLTIFENDLAEVLDRAWEKGLNRILIPGIDIETSKLALRLCEVYPNLYAAVGVHPNSALSWKEDELTALRELARHPKTGAIGEIGLDYYRDRAPRPVQQGIFRTQLDLAGELGLPVVIHNRNSYPDVWHELSSWYARLAPDSAQKQRPGVIHSFDGTLLEVQQAVADGFFIGITGPVTFHNAVQRQAVAAQISMENILIETDAPYLTPHPFRGRRNEPAYVALVAEKLAELHTTELNTVIQTTGRNAEMLFHWGANP